MNEDILKNILDNYSTPLYVFDICKLKERIKYLRENLPKHIELCYAIKANTFIIKDIEDIIDRYEVCSPGEYEICKKNNISQNKIVISGVYKTPSVIENMLENDKNINSYTIESLEQLELLKNVKNDIKIQVLIRLTSGNQFGIDENELEEIIKNRAKYENLDVKGIQYFSGTQKISLKNIKKEIEYVDELVKRLYEKYGFIAEEIEYGGGFPVHYFENSEFDENEYLREFSEIINQMKYKGKFIIELGRSIAASCGSYITKVVDKKTNRNQNYAILDGGMNHLVYFGQSMAMKVPKCEIYPKRNNAEGEKWNLCGALCTTNDILVKQFPVSNLQIGDIFIFKNTGAYCMTEGISLFLSRDLPHIIKITENKKIELIRKNIPTYTLNM